MVYNECNIICYIPAQIPYASGHLGQNAQKHLEQDDEIAWFLPEKYCGGYGQKWVWLLWSHGSKTDCISKKNQWNRMIFLKSNTSSGKLKITLIIFGWSWSKIVGNF